MRVAAMRAVDRGRHLRLEHESAMAAVDRLVLWRSKLAPALGGRDAILGPGRCGPRRVRGGRGLRAVGNGAGPRRAVASKPGGAVFGSGDHCHKDERPARPMVSRLGLKSSPANTTLIELARPVDRVHPLPRAGVPRRPGMGQLLTAWIRAASAPSDSRPL